MRLEPAGPVAGARAEFLAVKGTSPADVAATADPNRRVIHRGRLVSSTDATVTTASWSRINERQVSA